MEPILSSYNNLNTPTTVTTANILNGITVYDNNGNLINGNVSFYNSNTLKLIKDKATLSVEGGKKDLIIISLTSYNHSTQQYKPSIISGFNIEKTSGQIRNVFDVIASYIVTASSNTITIKGNDAYAIWTFFSYYKID